MGICFRQIPGFCGVRLTQTRITPGDGVAAAVGTNCATSFIRVPEAKLTANAAGVITPTLPGRVCGAVLNSQTGATTSGPVDNLGFRIGVFADGATAQAAGTGFDLMYQQIPCS